jgi:hypothetical protein
MQILVVHHDAEVGEQLAQMIRDYTEHQCGFANSDAAALDWSRGVTRCSLLITQLQAEGVNGLSLGATLCDTFAGMQTIFLPDYSSEDQRLDISLSKVFPEPIEGERLLEAIARADAQRQTGHDLFHALDVLQMCCLSSRSGALQLVSDSKTALVYLLNGNIVHAERGAARGAEALFEIVPWDGVEFAYDYSVRAPVQTITTPWDEAIIGAVNRRKAQIIGSLGQTQKIEMTDEPPPQAKPARWGIFGGGRK